jgi:benzoyl-CoA 2,3-dioxygenase component B
VVEVAGDAFRTTDEPALNAINERLRDDYITDCQRGVDRWNRTIKRAGIDFELKLPHRAFHRAIGQFSEVCVSPEGRIITQAEWDEKHHDWLPTDEDRAYVRSLMTEAVTEPGKFANWIAPPARGINNQPLDFEYVRFA